MNNTKISNIVLDELESLRQEIDDASIGIIYGHYNPVENKWYIGQTIHWKNPGNRWGASGSKYISEARKDRKFAVALKNSGWDSFEHHILKYCKQSELFYYENLFINLYDSFNNGYNETEGNKNLSESSRLKISESKKGTMIGSKNHMYKKNVSKETREKLSRSHIGKKDSEETRLKKSLSHIGHPVSEKTIEHIRNLNRGKSSAMSGVTGADHHSSKAVIFVDDNDNVIFEFSSIREAAEHFGFKSQTTISNYCTKLRKFKLSDGTLLNVRFKCSTIANSTYKMSEETKRKLSDIKKGKSIVNGNHIKKICMLDPISSEVLKIFDNAELAASYLNMPNASHIRACCRGERKSCYNYNWRYLEESNNDHN